MTVSVVEGHHGRVRKTRMVNHLFVLPNSVYLQGFQEEEEEEEEEEEAAICIRLRQKYCGSNECQATV